MKVLEVVGCRSSVVRALVAKVRGHWFDTPVTTNIFSHFTFAFDLERVILVFMKGQNLISVSIVLLMGSGLEYTDRPILST